MKFCSKCLVFLTHDEMLAKDIKESLGSMYNHGYGRTVWRKQIDHNYCAKCKNQYKRIQEEEQVTIDISEKRFVLFCLLPIAITVIILLITVFYFMH